jgi:secreted trypsin-like serine protease
LFALFTRDHFLCRALFKGKQLWQKTARQRKCRSVEGRLPRKKEFFMKLNFFIAGTAALLLASCSPASHSNEITTNADQAAIFGGEDVSVNDVIATTTVGLYNEKAGYLCTGSLYGKNMVITAAHCLEGNPADLEVRFGVDMRRPAVVRHVIAGQKNSRYTGKIQANMGDVSVLKYEGTLPAGYTTAPILTNYNLLAKGAKIVAAGYGISAPSRGKGAGVLRKITLKVKNPVYSATEISVGQSLINGVCSGDSGGPAFVPGSNGRLYLWGVTSNGAGLPGVRPCMFFAVFTRVDAYVPWISEVAGKL